MSRYQTTSGIIDEVSLSCMMPKSQITVTTADFISFIDDAMDTNVVPFILKHHQDYLLRSTSVPLVAGVTRYEIPHRAIGSKLRDLSYKDSSNTIHELSRIQIDDVSYNQNTSYNSLKSFYIEGDEIVLHPEQSVSTTSGSLIFSYYNRPNRMVLEAEVATITAINGAVLTLSNMPTKFSTIETFDFIKSRSPFTTLEMDKTPTTILGNDITFNIADLPTKLKVGDYLSLSEQTMVPQVPLEIHQLLIQNVVSKVLLAIGDREGLAATNADLAALENAMQTILTSRVESAPLKIGNRHGFLRQTRKLFGK